MKREKEQWLRIFNGVMFGALILLGFAYCDENSMGAGSENCTSYAKYEFRGKVLGESRQVVPDARILVKHIASPADGSYGYAVLSDTVYTKENGEYLYQNTITGYQDFRIICEDLTGVYQTDSVDIKMNPKGGNGRYEGKDNREVVFKLKKRGYIRLIRGYPAQSSLSRFLYPIASAKCEGCISSQPSRSAMVRETFKMRS